MGRVPAHWAQGIHHLWADPRMDTCKEVVFENSWCSGSCPAEGHRCISWDISYPAHICCHLWASGGGEEERPVHSCGEQQVPSLQPGEESPQQLHRSNGVCSDTRWFSSSQLNTSRMSVDKVPCRAPGPHSTVQRAQRARQICNCRGNRTRPPPAFSCFSRCTSTCGSHLARGKGSKHSEALLLHLP